MATVIILDDRTGTEVDEGTEKPDAEGIYDTVYDGDETIYIYYRGSVPSKIAQMNAIIDELESQVGIDHVEEVKLDDPSAGDFTAKLVRANGSSATLTGSIILATAKMDSDGMDDVIDELENQTTNPYKFGGDVTMDAKAHTVTFTGAYGTSGTDSIVTGVSGPGGSVTLLDDIARFLGGLYRQMGVRAIVFDDEDYTWDVNRTLKGSNWVDSSSGTLVAAIEGKASAAITGNNNTINGVSFTMELDGVTWTVKIVLAS